MDGPGAELGGPAAKHLAVRTAGIFLLGAAQRGKVGAGVRGGGLCENGFSVISADGRRWNGGDACTRRDGNRDHRRGAYPRRRGRRVLRPAAPGHHRPHLYPTLERLAGQLGRDRPLADITDEDLDRAASQLWAGLAPRTWNRHLATVSSFLAWCRRHGWPTGNLALRADRRSAAEDDTRAIPLPEFERLWARTGIPLRERALWRLLYDSAARADEVLGLDVPDLDLANRQARAHTKGGHTRPLHFQTAAARLLAKLVAGCQAGPVFLTERRASAHRVVAAADLDPTSGRARLSYEMAEQLFKRYSGGKTLHQLRHPWLTHLAEANVSAPLLMAISGYKRLATLQRYVKPSQAAAAALMASSDPDRRGR